MSQVGWTKQLILAITLFCLGMFAYWVEYKHKPEKEAFDEQAKKIFVLKDHPVAELRIQNGAQTYQFHCLDLGAKLCKPGDNSKWEVTEPFKLKADDANVNSLVSTLNNLVAADVIDLRDETPEKREKLMKEYGLDKAALSAPGTKRVEAVLDGNRVVAYLGGTHPIGDGIFTVIETLKGDQKADGNPDLSRVYVLPSYFKSNLDKELTYWREKRILTVSAQEVQGFRLKGSKGTVEGHRTKDGGGQWILGSGSGEVPGDIENIDSMLSAASYLSAKEFTTEKKDDAKAKEALKQSSPVVTLELEKNAEADKKSEPITLTLYQKAKHKDAKSATDARLFATVSNLDPLFELEGSARDRLDKSVKDLRLAKLITSMERFAAKRLEVAGGALGGAKIVILNKDGKWQREGGAAVSAEKVQAMLEKLSGNRIRDYLDLSKATGADTAEKMGVKIVIGPEKQNAGNPPRELLFWRGGGQLYARDLGSKRKEAYVVDPAITNDLPWKADFFDPPAVAIPGVPPKAPTRGEVKR